jgi:hypothetical protein
VVGRIEILPPLSSATARAARGTPRDQIAAAAGARDRAPRPAPGRAGADIIIDINAAGDPERVSTGASRASSDDLRRALPYPPAAGAGGPSQAGAVAGASDRATLRDAGVLAYRSADGLVADYAHRGTFVDLSI